MHAVSSVEEWGPAVAVIPRKLFTSQYRSPLLTSHPPRFSQVCAALQSLGRVAGVGVAPIVGGIAPVKQERLLARRPEVVVATPGRLWDLMRWAAAADTGCTAGAMEPSS